MLAERIHDTGLAGWSHDWLWGLLMIAVTFVLHAIGLGLIARSLIAVFGRIVGSGAARRDPFLFKFSSVVAAAVLLLACLHGLEAWLWAFAYVMLGASPNLHDAMLYSMTMVTTVGPIGVVLTPGWNVMGTIEAMAGMLLFGLSTAFLFAVLSRVWPVSLTSP